MAPEFTQLRWNDAVAVACRRLVRLSLEEDLAGGADVTTEALVPADSRGRARVVARAPGVAAGMPAVACIAETFGRGLRADAHLADCDPFEAGEALATIEGDVRSLLTLERTLLNLLGRLLGVATLTRRYVDAIEGTGAEVYDTRKTTPGWRLLEKYAVRCGGGQNHRLGLHDAVLIKDNHLAQAGRSPAEAVELARRSASGPLLVEIEVDTLEQLRDVLPAGPDIVLLDNMPPGRLREAVGIRNHAAPAVRLEASGGVRLETVRSIAETGVDRISVGALTHSAVALDVGLDWLDAC